MLRTLCRKIKNLFCRDWGKIWSAWRWMLHYVRQYRRQIVLYTALQLFSTVFGLVSSVASKYLIDAVTGHQSGTLGWAIALYAGLGIGQIFMGLLTGRLSLLMQTKVQQEIQADVFDRILYTDWESMTGYTTGDLLVRANGDARTVASQVLHFFPSAISTLVQLAGAFVIVCWQDPVMAVLALAGAPVTLLTSQFRLAKMREYQKESWDLYGEKMNFDQETFQNIQSIKSFDLLEVFSRKMRALQQKTLQFSLRQYRYQAGNTIVSSLTGLAVSYACYGFAVYRLWQGQISFGTMTLFISLAGSLTGAFHAAVHLLPEAIRTAASAERIMEIVGLPRESFDSRDTAAEIRREAAQSGVYIRAEHLSFQYKTGRTVYQDTDFSVKPGEIIALTGPSGQGKTTVLRLLLGLLHPAAGKLVIGNPGGHSLEISPSTRCLFSYVPQDHTIFQGTVAENLRLVRAEATDAELEDVLRTACAWDFVRELPDGLHTRIGERGTGLSEGQKQRLAIARALLADAPVLLLDEATSALDMETERQVLHGILQKDPHRSVIVTAHRPSVFSLCSRIYKVTDHAVTLLSDPSPL